MKKIFALVMLTIVSVTSFAEYCQYTNAITSKDIGGEWEEWEKRKFIFCIDGDNSIITLQKNIDEDPFLTLIITDAEKYSNGNGSGYVYYCYNIFTMEPATIKIRNYEDNNKTQSQVYFYCKDGIILFDITL
jgi:hypothetical protein